MIDHGFFCAAGIRSNVSAGRVKRLCQFLLIALFPLSLAAQTVQVSIDRVEELARENSPAWQMMNDRLDALVYGEQSEAVRLNPSIQYDLEQLDSGTDSEWDHYLYLNKEVRTPDHMRSLRQRRDSRIRFHEHESASERNQWIASARLVFVQIVLKGEALERLRTFERHVEELAEAAESRAGRGEITRTERQLLEMSGYRLQLHIHELQKHRSIEIEQWKALVGLEEGIDVEFAGRFAVPDFVFPHPAELMERLHGTPGALADLRAVEAAGFQTGLEQSRRIPSVHFHAGYRQRSLGWHGFMVGVRVPIPLLSANRESLEQARSMETFERVRLDYRQRQRRAEASRLLFLIDELQEKIDRFPDDLVDPRRFLNPLLAGYREGGVTLHETLSAIHLAADTWQLKFELLDEYYGAVTSLESLTGTTFIEP